MHGYYPLVIQIENEKGLPKKRVGILFARYSLVGKIRNARQAAVDDALYYGALVLLSTLVIWIVLHIVISRRLNLLTSASRSMAAGDLDVQVELGGQDEITELGESFNDMVGRVKQDISKRQQAEESLRELNVSLEDRVNERTEQLRQAQHIARMGNWRWDIEQDELVWSDELFTIMGLDIVRNKLNMAYYLQLVHPDDREEVESYFRQSSLLGNSFSLEHRVIRGDQSTCWVQVNCIADQGDDGKAVSLHGVMQDVSARKEELEEKAVLESQLQHAQKMEALGQLTGGIAHDFNNILASILGFADLAKHSLDAAPGSKLNHYLDMIVKSGERATGLIRQMLTFSRVDGDIEQREDVRVNSLLEEVSAMLSPTFPSSIDFKVIPGDDSLFVHVNTVMMNQVLMNLCLNARDALEDSKGSIIVELSVSEKFGYNCSSCHQSLHGNYVVISVSDNGCGISPKALEKVFDPFFSTKEVGKGTGMGLAIVHGIMHKHCGHIVIETGQGKGTCMRLLLPSVEVDGTSANSEIQVEENRRVDGDRKVIMVVDDEPAITMFMGDLLEREGYCPVVMNSSRDALNYFVENHDRVDLVITDQTMPGLTGDRLVEAMMAIEPDIPVILCTGYSQIMNREQALAMNILEFMEKPLNPFRLLKVVNAAVSGNGEGGMA